MKQAQIIVEFTIITAFALVFIALVMSVFSVRGIEQQATFGVNVKGQSGVVVPSMTP